MRCEDCAASLPDLLEGSLPDAQAEELRAHLAGCPACRAALALQEGIAAGLRMPPAADLPVDFTARVLARAGVRDDSRRRWRGRWFLIGAGSLASAGAAGLAVWLGQLARALEAGTAWHQATAAIAAGTRGLLHFADNLANGFGAALAGGAISPWGVALISVVALAPIIWGLVKTAEFYQE
jgi:anti-sigma factor RsiW